MQFTNTSNILRLFFQFQIANNCFGSQTSNSPSVTDIFPEKISQWSSGVHSRLGIASTMATKANRIFREDRRNF